MAQKIRSLSLRKNLDVLIKKKRVLNSHKKYTYLGDKFVARLKSGGTETKLL